MKNQNYYSEELLITSADFWLKEFDRLIKLKEDMENSDERFDLNFSNKMDEIHSQLDVVYAHMAAEKKAIEKALKKLIAVDKRKN